MKSIIIFLAVAVSAPQIGQAQGTVTYLSNLGQPSTGSLSVGSNSWLAAGFFTGTNAGGYSLDSIQLAMTDASGDPSGFTAMLYISGDAGFFPAHSLGTVNGSLNPVTSGIYTYTPAPNLTLSPRTPYFIVLTAGTAVANGAYQWSLAGANSYNPSGGWAAMGGFWTSGNGSSWPPPPTVGYPQFAINATGVPEPGVFGSFVLGGLGLLWNRRKAGAVQ